MNSEGRPVRRDRGLNPSIDELAPQRKTLANGTNDILWIASRRSQHIAAIGKGGVYLTMAGRILRGPERQDHPVRPESDYEWQCPQPDEKHLYVTNGPALAVFDVGKDGSLAQPSASSRSSERGRKRRRQHVRCCRAPLRDQQSRRQVIGPDGKYLG